MFKCVWLLRVLIRPWTYILILQISHWLYSTKAGIRSDYLLLYQFNGIIDMKVATQGAGYAGSSRASYGVLVSFNVLYCFVALIFA